jgi:hypothetical protein
MTATGQRLEEQKGVSLKDYFDFEYKAERRQIVFVSQKEKHVRILEHEGERWIGTEFYEEADAPTIGDCLIPLAEIYRKVEFSGAV